MRTETKNGFKRVLAFALTLVMLLSMAPFTAASAYADYTVTVTVTGINGALVNGATVKLGEGTSAVTGADGVATFSVTDGIGGPFTLNVTAPGYADYSNDSVTPDGSGNINVQLTASTAGFDGAFTAKALPYTGAEQMLLSVDTSKLPAGATVAYTLNGTPTADIPRARECGTYDVGVTVTAAGYAAYTNTYSVEITQGISATITTWGGLSKNADGELVGKYDINKPKLINVKTLVEATVAYTLNGSAVTECPKVTGIGTYIVGVKITPADKTNYAEIDETYNIEITSSDIKIIHYNTVDDKENSSAECSLSAGDAGVDFSAKLDDGMYYEGKLKDEAFSIHYDMEADASTGIVIDTDGAVKWNQNGKTTHAGLYTFTAEVYENGAPTAKYSEDARKLTYTLVLYNEGSLRFAEPSVVYTLYSDAPNQTAINDNDNDKGTVAYSINPENSGIKCEKDGTLSVDTAKLLAMVKAAEKGECKYIVTAHKEPYKESGHTLYGEAETSYELVIKAPKITDADAAKAAYTVTGGTKIEGSDWYNSDVTVTANDGYSLADTKAATTTYGDEVTFTENGETQDIYIHDANERKAYSKYPIGIKIDKEKPTDFHIEYRGAVWFKKVGEVISLGVAKTGLKVILTATDGLSGVKEFKWWFAADGGANGLKYEAEGASVENVPVTEAEAISAINQNESQKSFAYEFELIGDSTILNELKQYQYKGAIKATVSDRAGNIKSEYDKLTVYTTDSNAEGDNDTNVVIDQISPVISDVVVPNAVNTVEKTKTDYYKSDVTVSFKLTEANIESDDVVLTVKKDGKTIAPTITWDNTPEAGKPVDTTYTGSFTLSGDGKYTFAIDATDKAGNSAKRYEHSNTIVIDTTPAKVALTFKVTDTEGQTRDGKQYTKGNVEYTVTVEDNFFNKDNVTVTGTIDKSQLKFTDKKNGTYTATFEVDAEGEYGLTVKYTDFLNRTVTGTTDINPVIDKTAPQVKVVYADGKTSKYYTYDERTATITVKEVNFDEATVNGEFIVNNCITAKDVTGNDVAKNVAPGTWSTSGDERSMDVVFKGEANYAFDFNYISQDKEDLSLKDLAGNKAVIAEDYEAKFTIDRTAPTAPEFSYNIKDANKGKSGSLGKWIDSIINGIKYGFWNTDIEVTVTVEDTVAGAGGENAVEFEYTRAQTVTENGKTVYVSGKNADTMTGYGTLTQETGTPKFTGIIRLPADAVDKTTDQLNGTLKVTVKDLCGNTATGKDDSTRIVYDTISPTSKVTLTGVVNTEGDTKYFNSQIGVGISLVESNFFEDTIKATSNNSPVNIKWTSTDADNHQGSFNFTSDGEYRVNITGMDYAGNSMTAYDSGMLILDTKIEEPTIEINGEECDGRAYKDDAILTISFFDTNYSSVDIKIFRTRLGEKDVDVTEKFVSGKIETDAEGGMVYIDTLSKIQDNDGIYTVVVTVTDKATNSASATATFTLNRFGSVYEYGSYLRELIKNGGDYVKKITQDLTVTEYNADRLIDGSMKVEITKDGKLIKNPIFTVKQIKAEKTDKGAKGWYEYAYTISKDNFKEDGFYKIVISSRDATGNRPENSNYKGMEIQFYVDSVPPELSSVTGLEKAIVNAEKVDVKYTAYDTVGLKSVKVYVNGELYEEIKDFSGDPNNYNGVITIGEATRAQSVRIVIEDLAGNITDTDSEDFVSAYTMVKSVLVSTSFFARFYGNKPLFWGTVGGVLFLAAFTGIIIPLIKRRKEKEEEEEAANIR